MNYTGHRSREDSTKKIRVTNPIAIFDVITKIMLRRTTSLAKDVPRSVHRNCIWRKPPQVAVPLQIRKTRIHNARVVKTRAKQRSENLSLSKNTANRGSIANTKKMFYPYAHFEENAMPRNGLNFICATRC